MENVISILSAIVLAITAWIIWEYTKEAQRSNEIQEMPILNLYLREISDGPVTRKLLKLRNVGKGPAYNIQISSIQTEHVTYVPNFRQANFILEAIKDERAIMFDVEKISGGFELFEDYAKDFELFIDRIFPRNTKPQQREFLSRTAGIFLITYEGVNKKSYYSIFRIYPKTWPMINVYDVAIEFVENNEGRCDLRKARQICEEKKVLLKE